MRYLWLFVFALTVVALEPGQIAINEICFNPDGVDEEWIEIRNNLDIPVVLDETVSISDGEGTYFFEGITIAEGDFLTLMTRTEGSFPFEVDLDISEALIQLANGQDEIIIKQGETIIDSVKYKSSWTTEGSTIERINPFFTAIHPDNWGAGTFVDGTPDRENSLFASDTDFPPAILDAIHEPNMPTSADLVEITAEILDEEILSIVELIYIVSNDTTYVSMTHEGDNVFTGETEMLAHGSLVNYMVIAWDESDQCDSTHWHNYFVIDSTVEGTIVINEMMYDSPGSDTEWVEIYNRSLDDVDLSGWILQDASSSYFTFDDGVIIGGQGYLVIAKNQDEFAGHYGPMDNLTGNFPFSLNNSGDSLILRDDEGRVIDIVGYSTSVDWPIEPHGSGFSLSLIDPELDNRLGSSWLASTEMWGNPGSENFPASVSEKMPQAISIASVKPNPFNGAVEITIAQGSHAQIYDIKGNFVHRLQTGKNIWTPEQELPSGIYLIKAVNDKIESSKRIVYLK